MYSQISRIFHQVCHILNLNSNEYDFVALRHFTGHAISAIFCYISNMNSLRMQQDTVMAITDLDSPGLFLFNTKIPEVFIEFTIYKIGSELGIITMSH